MFVINDFLVIVAIVHLFPFKVNQLSLSTIFIQLPILLLEQELIRYHAYY